MPRVQRAKYPKQGVNVSDMDSYLEKVKIELLVLVCNQGWIQDLQKEGAPQHFTLEFTVNFKDGFQIPKFQSFFYK
jgi:hypothetical protein